ncbi:hypothetical protein PIB30_048839 [Stylosanthes scabra]|uniref:Uncharacterized protein n=1 Tax=Stylosanthes scabra TaxID=79078 RepID=A0ABU6UG31_9FABA|nr:hypothetical protein [Stylosanthes scabra]
MASLLSHIAANSIQIRAESYSTELHFHLQLPSTKDKPSTVSISSTIQPISTYQQSLLNLSSIASKKSTNSSYFIPALIGFCTVTTPPPFQVHPLTTQACALGIFCYFLAFMASLHLPQYTSQLSKAMAVFGSFTSVTLIHSEICLEN